MENKDLQLFIDSYKSSSELPLQILIMNASSQLHWNCTSNNETKFGNRIYLIIIQKRYWSYLILESPPSSTPIVSGL